MESTSPVAATVSGKTYQLTDNSLNANAMSLTFGSVTCAFTLRDNTGTHRVTCGLNHWATGDTTFSTIPLKLVATPVPGEIKTKVAGSGTWTDANTFVMTWRFIETAHYETIICRFEGDSVSVSFENSIAKINKTKDLRPVLVGKLRAETGVRG